VKSAVDGRHEGRRHMPNAIGEFDVEGSAWSPPAKRAEVAHARADELRLRRADLESGAQTTSDVTALARRRAAQAVERAAEAWRAALHRHVEAQQAHLRAAAAHEQAAMTVGDDECDMHQTAAERHRAAAAFHADTVAQLSANAPLETPSAGVLHQQ
jgi:hypothetical protein